MQNEVVVVDAVDRGGAFVGGVGCDASADGFQVNGLAEASDFTPASVRLLVPLA